MCKYMLMRGCMRCFEGESSEGLEMECDAGLQRREWRIERVGRGLMLLAVLIALAGLMGGDGPLNQTRLRSKDGMVQVEYEWLLRQQNDSQMIWRLTPAQAEARLGISREFLDKLSVKDMLPAPTSIRTSGEDAVLVFETLPYHPLLLTMGVQARHVGMVQSPVTLNGKPVGELRVWVLP
jgi:hypothetical protein